MNHIFNHQKLEKNAKNCQIIMFHFQFVAQNTKRVFHHLYMALVDLIKNSMA